MAETGCGDPPTDGKSKATAVTNQASDAKSEDNQPDLASKVAKLESQIEDVTSTLKDEQENRRLLQHELELSRKLCESLQNRSGTSAEKRGGLNAVQDQGIQTKAAEDDDDDTLKTGVSCQTEKEISSSRWQPIHSNKYSAASHLLEEYTTNQRALEDQVKKLSQECAAKDEEMSRVGQKYAVFIKRNAQLEKDVESLRSCLSRQEQTVKRQQKLLEKKNHQLGDKTEALKELKLQKDSLAERYRQAKTKAARLKEVVISFNKTVSEFRKEREKVLSSTLLDRGISGALKVERDATTDQNQSGDKHHLLEVSRGSSNRSEPLEAHHQYSEESSFDSWRNSDSPEAETRRDADTGHRGSVRVTDDDQSSASQARSAWSRNHNWHDAERSGQPPIGTEASNGVATNFLKCRGVSGTPKDCHRDATNFKERISWPQLLRDGSSQSERSNGSQLEVNSEEQISADSWGSDEDEVCRFQLRGVAQTGSNDEAGRMRRRRHSTDVILRGTSSSNGSEASAAENVAPEHDYVEGLILLKHDMENYSLKASDRSWNFVYIVHEGRRLWFYENRDFVSLGLTLDGMDPIDLTGAIICPLRDYVKRNHVFCVQLRNGARYLFQARDEGDMLFWVCRLTTGTGELQEQQRGRECLFAQRRAPLRGSPSKTDRLKNFLRGGLSAVWK